MKVTFLPSVASGTVQAPPSKSLTHRYLMCAGLARGKSVLHGVAKSGDVLSTLNCLRSLGAQWKWDGDTLICEGAGAHLSCALSLDCGESASSLRFFLPVCLLDGKERILSGSRNLFSRPLDVYESLCAERGISFRKGPDFVSVRGRLIAGEYLVPGDVSSQFVSGLLFALAQAEGDSLIRLIPPVQSRPYIRMTMDVLARSGVQTEWSEGDAIFVPGGQSYHPVEVEIEGDYSNAACLEAFNLTGGNVRVTGLNERSLQGDRIYREYFEALTQGFARLDLSDCPDLGPILFACAAMLNGGRFTGTHRLKYKESDRCQAMKTELEKFGVSMDIEDDAITVHSAPCHRPDETLDGHHDHRIVMALSLPAAHTGGTISGAEAVGKSFPDFFESLKSLGVRLTCSP